MDRTSTSQLDGAGFKIVILPSFTYDIASLCRAIQEYSLEHFPAVFYWVGVWKYFNGCVHCCGSCFSIVCFVNHYNFQYFYV